jgi:hypothetical protein
MMLHLLTAVLVVLKALEMIEISWWWCVAPSLLAFGFALFTITSVAALWIWAHLQK